MLIAALMLDAAAGTGTLASNSWWISDRCWRRPGAARSRRLKQVFDLMLIAALPLDPAGPRRHVGERFGAVAGRGAGMLYLVQKNTAAASTIIRNTAAPTDACPRCSLRTKC